MALAALTLELSIPLSRSLKDRRQVVRSMKDRLRQGFNISVAELDEAVTWQSATLGIAAISSSRDYLRGLMAEVESAATRLALQHAFDEAVAARRSVADLDRELGTSVDPVDLQQIDHADHLPVAAAANRETYVLRA